MISNIIYLILCHLIGDYILQIDFIAKTKGSNWYHLFVHSALYCVPFILIYELDWKIAILFIAHMIIDSLKARWNKISYMNDQLLHYILLLMFLL